MALNPLLLKFFIGLIIVFAFGIAIGRMIRHKEE